MQEAIPAQVVYIIIGIFILGAIRFIFKIRSFWGGTLNLNKGLWNQLRKNPEEMSHRIADEAKNKEEIMGILRNFKKVIKISKMDEATVDMTIIDLNNQQKTYRMTMTIAQKPQILSIKHIS